VSRLVAHGKLQVLSGDDSLTVPMMAIGARGVVSVASNLLPRPMADLVRAAATGDSETARVLHLSLFPIFRALFLETNPVPVKTALRLAGRLNGEVRLPLVSMTRENEEALRTVLVEAGLIS
jgi:4-hydroxy-tetrahydrodipicolinate synthase